MQIRTSEASWDGPLKEGKGCFWTQSGEVSGVRAPGAADAVARARLRAGAISRAVGLRTVSSGR